MKRNHQLSEAEADDLTIIKAVKSLDLSQKQDIIRKIAEVKEAPEHHVINSSSNIDALIRCYGKHEED
jgi:ligand-binding sensor protein